jgi:hypothetical protein
MKGPIFGALALLIACAGCGDDDDDDTTGSGGSGGTGVMVGEGGLGNSGDRCEVGCRAVIAADCPNSPEDQATCEDDCRELERGACGDPYGAFQDCAVGKEIVCTALGIPGAEGCEDEQSAFIACLAQ